MVQLGASSSGSNNVSIGKLNRVAVMRFLQSQSVPSTVADICQITGLTSATVSSILSDFIDESLVFISGVAESTGGRKPSLYALNPRAAMIAGVEMEIERLVVVLVDFTGQIIGKVVCCYDFHKGPHYVVSLLKELLQDLMQSVGVERSALSCIGFSLPGPIDFEKGMLLNPPNMPGWVNVPIVSMMNAELGIPCVLENDANAAAYGEFKYSDGPQVNNIIYIMVDVGIGSGILIDGKIYRGIEGGGAAIGHTIIIPDGPICNCGNHGCVESVASGRAIQQAAKKLGIEVSLEQLLKELSGRCTQMNDYIMQCGELLGIAVGNVCNMFAPEMVIIGGLVPSFNEAYYECVVEKARQCMMSRFSHLVQFSRARLGSYSSAVGAALICRDEFLEFMND